ncbi:MAG TPA: hypothetical protein VHL80_05760 [Polyangia bacterium]|nr:hypothetical protein [Polyangia bacterium]
MPAYGAPGAMVLGPDSNLWVIVNRAGTTPSSAVSRVTTAGTFTDFPLPAGAGPTRLCAGPDGNIWVAENSANKLARLVPSTGALTEYPLSVIGATITGLSGGPDGNIWFVEGSANRIGRLHP